MKWLEDSHIDELIRNDKYEEPYAQQPVMW